jgi:hypothetical protein
MYRSVLTQAGFVRWANEHLVVLVAHNELGHDPVVNENATGDEAKRCPLYPGMTCREHLNAAVDIDTARDEELVAVPFVELCPNTWLVHPDRQVVRVEEQDQFAPKTVRKQVEAAQEKLGPALSTARYVEIRDLLLRGDEALDEEAWRRALEDWGAVAKIEARPHASLKALIEARLTLLDEAVELSIDDLVEQENPTDEALAAGRALHTALAVPVLGRTVPSRERLGLWLDAYGDG